MAENNEKPLVENQNQAEEILKNADVVPIEEIGDFEDVKPENFKPKNVLLMTMSTLNVRDELVSESKYPYDKKLLGDKEGADEVDGIGQMEPVPKMMIKEGCIPDLILILASKETNEKEFKQKFKLKTKDGIKDREETAVDFFKEQMSRFVVGIIRKLKHENENIRLYLDIHGGKREYQIPLDAILSLLASEGVEIEQAFSVAGKDKPIKDVTDQMKIFQFVSAMNEFTNLGQGQRLKEFMEEKGSKNSDIASGINDISEALTLCQVEEFESALDRMGNAIDDTNEQSQGTKDYLDIFVGSIKNDYGNLLDKRKRKKSSLVLEAQWALNKGFYQQCLAIIESKTPIYFLKGICGIEKEDLEVGDTINRDTFLDDVPGLQMKNADPELELYYKLSMILLYNPSNVSLVKKRGKAVIECRNYKLKNNSGQRYNVELYTRFDVSVLNRRDAHRGSETLQRVFPKYIGTWKNLKTVRNNVMHSNDKKPEFYERGKKYTEKITLTKVEKLINDFLNELQYIEACSFKHTARL